MRCNSKLLMKKKTLAHVVMQLLKGLHLFKISNNSRKAAQGAKVF